MKKKQRVNINILDDEPIDMYDYTRDTRDLILSDRVMIDILNETLSGNAHVRHLSDAFRYLKLNKLVEFRRTVSKNRPIINIKFRKTFLLHEACRLGNPECVSLLLFLGGVCSVMDDNGYMAQHYATMSKSTVIIDILALFSNSMNVRDAKGNTPFYYALAAKDEEMLKTLMTYKANPFTPDIESSTVDAFIHDNNTNISNMLAKYIMDF